MKDSSGQVWLISAVSRKTAFVAAVTIALQLGIAVPRMSACECNTDLLPPCQAYWQSPMVFLGTVTESLPTSDIRIVRHRMTVDRAFKGVTQTQVTLLDNGMCAGAVFRVGEQYLMYTRPLNGVDLEARGCTRSRHVKSAGEDLKYLEGLENAAPTAAIFGRVAAWPEGPGDKVPQPGASVHLQGAGETLTVTADARGRYSFEGLEPGKYTVSADQPDFHMPEQDYGAFSATVEARGCAQIDVTLRKNWPGVIAGRLVRPDGTPPAAGIHLNLPRLRDGRDGAYEIRDTVHTDDHGDYAFRNVRPGTYKVVVHRCCLTSEVPNPAVYWPAGDSEEDGSEILVGASYVGNHYDFQLPEELKSRTVSGQVLDPDGKPASGSKVWLLYTEDEDQQCCRAVNDVRTDQEGHFSLTITEGIKYGLAVDYEGDVLIEEVVPVSFDEVPSPLVLRKEASTTQKDQP